jgi:hypothetical protein
MRAAATVIFLAVALVNLLPAVGALSTARLATLYGVAVDDPNLAILLRHRVLLFAIVGALLAIAAFDPRLRPIACVAGLFSMLSFVAIARAVGEYNGEIGRVVAIDVVASVALAVAMTLDFVTRPG